MQEITDYQDRMVAWVRKCFGEAAMRPHERICRLLEEVIELAQAEGVDKSVVLASMEHVYSKSPGNKFQECGGVAVTFLAYLASINHRLDDATRTELERIEAKSVGHFRERQQVKADAGMSDQDAPCGPFTIVYTPTTKDADIEEAFELLKPFGEVLTQSAPELFSEWFVCPMVRSPPDHVIFGIDGIRKYVQKYA